MRQGLTASSTHESQGAFPGQPSAGHRASETYPEFLLMKRRAASSKVADLPRCVHRVSGGTVPQALSSFGGMAGADRAGYTQAGPASALGGAGGPWGWRRIQGRAPASGQTRFHPLAL